jgi:hypothetical protein
MVVVTLAPILRPATEVLYAIRRGRGCGHNSAPEADAAPAA